MAWRAYPAILCVALASCNQIFGLNDPVGFIDAAPEDPVPVLCIDDRFETPDPSTWVAFDAATPFPVTVAGGELVIDIDSPNNGAMNGLVTSKRYDFTGGNVVVEITDLAAPSTEMWLEVTLDPGTLFRISNRDDELVAYVLTSAGGTALPIDGTQGDRVIRLRHDASSELLHYESGVDANNLIDRESHVIPAPTSVTVTLLGLTRSANAMDRVAFDNFKLTAFCPE